MNKTEFLTSLYDLLSPLESQGITVQGSESEVVSTTPLVTFSIINWNNELRRKNFKWVNVVVMVSVYGNNSVQCTEINDTIDEILEELDFSTTDLSNGYDRASGKHKLVSVYSRFMDEFGNSYNIA